MEDTSLEELYQEIIIQHSAKSKERESLANPDAAIQITNPLCGDIVKLGVNVRDHRVTDLGFQGHGCAISQAASSILCDALQGKSVEETEAILQNYKALIMGKELTEEQKTTLGDAVFLSSIGKFPGRVRCALLACEGFEKCISEASKAEEKG